MTAPAQAPICHHCDTAKITKRVHVKTPGSVPVDLTLCACDLLRCANSKCRAVVGNLPRATTHCPSCMARL